MSALTPFDTGARLEPQVWPAVDPDGVLDEDRYGRVDFDDDESATVLNVHVSCEDPSAESRDFVLAIESVSELRYAGEPANQELDLDDVTPTDSLTVLVDDQPAIVIGSDQREAFAALCDLARRGRDDFMYQAESTSDYSEEDIAAAGEEWEAVSSVIDRIEYLIDQAEKREQEREPAQPATQS